MKLLNAATREDAKTRRGRVTSAAGERELCEVLGRDRQSRLTGPGGDAAQGLISGSGSLSETFAFCITRVQTVLL